MFFKHKGTLFFILFLLLLAGHVTADSLKTISTQIQNGEHGQALTAVDQLLGKTPTDPQTLFLKARALEAATQELQAIEVYKQLIQTYPNMPEPYNNLAVLYAEQGKLDAARLVLEQGLNSHQSYSTIYNNLSNIYLEMARDSYIKALQLGVKPQNFDLKPITDMSKDITDSETPLRLVQSAKEEYTKTTASPIQKQQETPSDITIKKAALIPVSPKQAPIKKRLKVQVSTAAVNKPASPRNKIITTLKGWAAAWSAQNVGMYLSFYGNDYKSTQGLRGAAWKKQRYLRLRRPKWIKVKLSNFRVGEIRNGRVIVHLTQDYRSNSYKDRVRKQITLLQSRRGWQILAETNMSTLRR